MQILWTDLHSTVDQIIMADIDLKRFLHACQDASWFNKSSHLRRRYFTFSLFRRRERIFSSCCCWLSCGLWEWSWCVRVLRAFCGKRGSSWLSSHKECTYSWRRRFWLQRVSFRSRRWGPWRYSCGRRVLWRAWPGGRRRLCWLWGQRVLSKLQQHNVRTRGEELKTYSVLAKLFSAFSFGFVSEFVGLHSVHIGTSNIINNRP